MRHALTLLTAVAALTACGGQEAPDTTDAAGTTTSAPTTASAPTTTAAEDVAARNNCTMAGLAYAPIAGALNGQGDLAAALRYADTIDLAPATTDPGKDANVALAELAVEIGMAQITANAGQPVDQAPLLDAYTAAQDACAAVGIS